MSLSLAELLPLVGCLDDAPGFDTPRERFRRFLLQRVTDVPTARALIDDCQRSVGEQHHRALQDLVVIVGRLLGFAITFGSYESAHRGEQGGRWRSPGLLDVVLEIRTEQAGPATLEGLASAVAAAGAAAGAGELSIGLCVVARQYAARARLNDLLASHAQFPNLRVISVRSLLSLAAHVSADRVSHSEVVELLRSGVALDFVIDLVGRPVADNRSDEPNVESGRPVPLDRREPAFWIASITGDDMTPPEQLLATVIAHRRVLGVCRTSGSHGQSAPGDWVGFFLADKGVMGHAQLASVVEDSANVVRHADRFSRVYRLAQVTLYTQPIVQALRAERPFEVPAACVAAGGSYLAPIARQDFLALTAYLDGTPSGDGLTSATA